MTKQLIYDKFLGYRDRNLLSAGKHFSTKGNTCCLRKESRIRSNLVPRSPTVRRKEDLTFRSTFPNRVRSGYEIKYAVLGYNTKKQVTHSNTNPAVCSTLRMRTAKSPRQWQPWTAVSSLLGLLSMA